jgi:hypothetical protein
MTRLNQNALLPAGSKWLSAPNGTPSTADAKARASTDQPRPGVVLGLLDSLTLELLPGCSLSRAQFREGNH